MEDDEKMELFIKAGPDKKSIGDCPFAHYVRMVIALKGVDCEVIPLPPDDKPDWLIEDFEGKMPVLDHKGMRTGESNAIAVTLDETFPDPPLRFHGKEETAMKTLSGLFPAMAKVIKNPSLDFNSEKALLGQLSVANSYLIGKPKGDYILGEHISLADCSLTPKLYHLDVTLSHYYPDTRKKMDQFPQLKTYMAKMFESDAFKKTKYPPETLIWGWDTARGKTTASCGI